MGVGVGVGPWIERSRKCWYDHGASENVERKEWSKRRTVPPPKTSQEFNPGRRWAQLSNARGYRERNRSRHGRYWVGPDIHHRWDVGSRGIAWAPSGL